MPKSDDRFYLMKMFNREVMYGDIGGLIRLEGVVIGGGGSQAILMLPGIPQQLAAVAYHLGIEEWSDWLQRSDNPEVLTGPTLTGPGGATLPKIWHRKLRYEISGAVQQKVWAADGFQCMYCGVPMGKALMTIDHFIPLELGGENNVKNYVSSCKKDNKEKGSNDPREFCSRRKYDYDAIVKHLCSRIL
jgi:hypothetical protein